MLNYIKMPRCRVSDCIVKRAIFNYPGETQGICCSTHKLKNMINVKDKTCIYEGCNIQPIYNYPGEKISIYCTTHKKVDMINVRDKKCIHEGCNTLPSCNFPGENIGLYCAKHKEDDMINVKDKKCIHEGCNIRPCFNLPGEKIGLYCAKHKEDDMINVVSKTCINEGCNKIPHFNLPGEKTALYCFTHKDDNMINIKSKKCIHEGCNKIPNNNLKYNGYCHDCFIENFPDEPITRNYKVKENLVINYVKKEFREYNLVFDKIIQGGNSRRRPDILITKSTHSIIIENDENGHNQKSHEDENNRNMEIHNDLKNNKTVFIRFNPDSYIDENGKKVKSCFKIDKDTGLCRLVNEVEWNNRLETLKKTIEEYITTIPEKEITIIYLFYNKNTSS